PAYAGLLLEHELEQLGRLLGEVEHPFVLVSGGAKVEDKLGVLRKLGGKVDTVLIGGKMAEELREQNPLDFEVVLPSDVVAAASLHSRCSKGRSCPESPLSRKKSMRRRGSGINGRASESRDLSSGIASDAAGVAVIPAA